MNSFFIFHHSIRAIRFFNHPNIKNMRKKLELKKEVVAQLTNNHMERVMGGGIVIQPTMLSCNFGEACVTQVAENTCNVNPGDGGSVSSNIGIDCDPNNGNYDKDASLDCNTGTKMTWCETRCFAMGCNY